MTEIERLKIERDEALVAKDFANLACEKLEKRVAELELELAEEKAKLDYTLTVNEEGTLQWWIQKHDDLMVKLGELLLEFQRAKSQLEEARWLLNRATVPWPDPSFFIQTTENSDWRNRRDAWLSAHTPTGKEK